MSDEFINGELLSDLSIQREDHNYKTGDTAVIELYSLTRDAFSYIETVIQAENIDPIVAAPPANVPTNISNGALGYFLLSSRQSIEIIIE